MRKAIFIFIAIVLVAASIDWIRSCSGLKSHKEVFGRELTYAEMYEYKDADYDYVVRVPSFFTTQADSLQEEMSMKICQVCNLPHRYNGNYSAIIPLCPLASILTSLTEYNSV